MQSKFNQKQLVRFTHNGSRGIGRVVGQAAIGIAESYVVQFDPLNTIGIDPAVYPFSTIVVLATGIEPIELLRYSITEGMSL